ncbi:putative bifunctional diguanylate cyclase/phosphodiesterase [Pleomorphomonas sp. PLEO]|uniref:putative bifunctional diguanylate cyclase/phosphodiesterase n=1 Tax=Pleomorphomonas sp. PLEO TaxID=3239306 RepID=UPI00351EC2CE
MWIFDFDSCRVVWANPPALQVWSAETVEELRARDLKTDMSPAVARRLRQYRTDFVERDVVFTEMWTLYPKGVPRPMHVRFRRVTLGDGRIGMLCEGNEETARQPEAVRSADALLHTQLMISLHASNGQTLYSNPAARTAFETNHRNLRARFVDADDFNRLVAAVERDGETSLITEVHTTRGIRWHELTARSCHDPASGLPSLLVSETDVSGLKEAEALARMRADHDSLTLLPNRMALPGRFERLVRKARRLGARIGVLFIDLDQFKEVNDTLGHEQGDAILTEVARRLSSLCDPDDCAFRLGGDEFLVIALAKDDEPDRIARLADDILRQLSVPAHLERRRLTVTPSIGIAYFPEHGQDAQTLMQRADLAMYAAKAAGRNQYCLFDESIQTTRDEELNLLGDIRGGLERDEFEAFFQPRVCAQSHKIVCVEALARWRHPERGLLMPAQFIPLAETAGLIGALGLSILKQSLSCQRAWAKAGLPINVSVNVSLRQLGEAEFGTILAQLVEDYGCSQGQLELEITETLLLEHNPQVAANLAIARSLGVRIAIDDFGTGYSNLARLAEIRVDCIKIDRSLISGLPKNEPLVKMVIAMCRLMQVTIVAEGLETEEAADWASRNGCHELQGYLFGKPMPTDQIEAALRAVTDARPVLSLRA